MVSLTQPYGKSTVLQPHADSSVFFVFALFLYVFFNTRPREDIDYTRLGSVDSSSVFFVFTVFLYVFADIALCQVKRFL